MNAARRGEPVDAERRRDPIDGALGQPGIEAPLAAEEISRIEIAEHQIGVGDGRFGAALAIAGRPRRRAGALRPDMQDAAGIDPRDRAAAGADRGDIEAVERDAVAGDAAVHDQRRLAVDDEADVGAGAAHIERDQVGLTREPRRVDAAGDAAGRPDSTAPAARRRPRRSAPPRHATG